MACEMINLWLDLILINAHHLRSHIDEYVVAIPHHSLG